MFKANSCQKFEAKISEKSEKKGSEYLKRTSESHVKRISVRLLFALKRKKFLSETGAPYSQLIGGFFVQGTRIYLAMPAPGSVEEDDSILLHFVNLFVIVGRNYLNGFAFK